MVHESWKEFLSKEFEKEYFKKLSEFTLQERKSYNVYPPHEDVLQAFEVPFDKVKVVILGQDPYHGPGQAHGLCFSVRPGIEPPPSLKNILKELKSDLGIESPNHGCLYSWVKQGVFLLNTVLTVREGQPGSHQGYGWEIFTNEVIQKLNSRENPVIFILWGKYAQAKKLIIDDMEHVVLSSAHPSPLSAWSGFFGSRPFSKTNSCLEKLGNTSIDWSISNI